MIRKSMQVKVLTRNDPLSHRVDQSRSEIQVVVATHCCSLNPYVVAIQRGRLKRKNCIYIYIYISLEEGMAAHSRILAWRLQACAVCLVTQLPLSTQHMLFLTPWTVAFQCPWGFSRKEDWNGFPCPPPGDLPSPGI